MSDVLFAGASKLESVRRSLGIDHRLWADFLGMTKTEYSKNYLHQSKLEIKHFFNLGNAISYSPSRLMTGNIDLATIYEKYTGNQLYIPEEYQVAAQSKVRSLNNFLNHLEKNHSPQYKQLVLREFNLNEAILSRPDMPINILMMMHFFTYLRSLNLNSAHFFAMGAGTVEYNKLELLSRLGPVGDICEFWEKVIAETPRFFEYNTIYKIKHLTEQICVLTATPNKEVQDALHMKVLGNPDICLGRAGIKTSASAYLGFPHSQVTKTKCIHIGDPHCEFHIIFNDNKFKQLSYRH